MRVAVVGAGDFGRNHARVYRELTDVNWWASWTRCRARGKDGGEFYTKAFRVESLRGQGGCRERSRADRAHAEVGCRLMEMGIDVLVEKPMAASLAEADRLMESAGTHKRILQVGHLERFNPAVLAVEPVVKRPLYFEVHRLGVFTPRSLDIDVVYDVMIHDLDILLALVKETVTEVRALGIPVLTEKVDIAHARLEFAAGAVANVTASRVSTERVRKMRFFQEHEYISLDYARQDALRVGVKKPGPAPEFGFEKLAASTTEPLQAELEAFVEAVRTRIAPKTDGTAGKAALELASRVLESIREHDARVQPVAKVNHEKTT